MDKTPTTTTSETHDYEPRSSSPDLSIAPTGYTGFTHWTQMPPAPDENQVRDVLTSMKDTLEQLGGQFENLGQQGERVARFGEDFDHAAQIASLRRHLLMSDQKNETRTEEIKTLLRARHYDVIHEEIIPYIRQVVAQEVDRQIETAVREVVAEELGYLVPDPLQIQIREHTEQLEEIQISLRNAEARRQNSLLRSTYLNDPLHPLLKPSGKVSPNFPRDLATLFELDGAAAKALNMEYGLQDVGDGREKNLNRFMQFIGVPYQMRPLYYEIRPRGSTPGVPAYSPDPKTELYSQIKAGRRIQALRIRGPMPTAKSPAGHTSLDQRSPTPLLSFTKEIEDYDVPLGTAEVPATREAIIHVTRGKALPPRDAFGVHFLSGVVAATGQLAALYLSRGGEGVY